ncbi:MAG: hypothetical protein WC686_04770 [Candidatus Shapirobacteria bacterium]|jgi:hypothetical protein
MKNKKVASGMIFGVETDLITILIWPFVALTAFLVIMLGVVLPRYNEIGEMNKKVLDTIQKRQSILDKKNYLSSVNQEVLKRNVVTLNNALLKEKNWYTLITVVNQVARDFGFQLESFNVNPGKVTGEEEEKAAKEMTLKIPITLTLIGPKSSYLDFLLALEKTLPLLVLDRFEMKVSGETIGLDLVVSSYYLAAKPSVIGNLSLADLALKPEENEILKTLGEFRSTLESGKSVQPKEYVRYGREDPFNF